MRRTFRRRAASGAAALATLWTLSVLGGCAAALGPDLRGYDLPEDGHLDALPWPSLAEVPAPPPPGTFTAAVPDPALGQAALADLGAEAARMRARAEELAAPVLTEAERRRLAAGLRPP